MGIAKLIEVNEVEQKLEYSLFQYLPFCSEVLLSRDNFLGKLEAGVPTLVQFISQNIIFFFTEHLLCSFGSNLFVFVRPCSSYFPGKSGAAKGPTTEALLFAWIDISRDIIVEPCQCLPSSPSKQLVNKYSDISLFINYLFKYNFWVSI